MTYKIELGNALTVIKQMKKDNRKVDCIVTSPPYWNLREYGSDPVIWNDHPECQHTWDTFIVRGEMGGRNSKKQHCKGMSNFQEFDSTEVHVCSKCNAMNCSLGREPSPEIFVEHLVEIFNACWDILEEYGTLWINAGDTYAGSGGKGGQYSKDLEHYKQEYDTDIAHKSLCAIPQLLMIRLVEEGWICRNELIWHKPNSFVQPVYDRFTRNGEKIYLFGKTGRCFFFTKNPKYYFLQQLEPYQSDTVSGAFGGKNHEKYGREVYSGKEYSREGKRGRNMREIMFFPEEPIIASFNTASWSGKHAAVFPLELPLLAIDAGCAKQVCTKCGQPITYEYTEGELLVQPTYLYKDQNFLKEVKCSCNAPFRKGVVLDPFCGTGTTLEASILKEVDGVGIELNPDFIKESERRLSSYNEDDANGL